MARRELAGLRVLVTGASQGIGRAIAELAAKRGMKVLASARSVELLNQLAEEVRKAGHTLEVVQADIAKPEGREAMVRAAQDKFGVEIPDDQLKDLTTVQDVVNYVSKNAGGSA